MITSTTISGATEPLSLDQLGVVLMNREKVPYGFFVSRALWDALNARFKKETGGRMEKPAHAFNGVQTAIDPTLPETEFVVAFTQAAWSKRLAELRALSAGKSQ